MTELTSDLTAELSSYVEEEFELTDENQKWINYAAENPRFFSSISPEDNAMPVFEGLIPWLEADFSYGDAEPYLTAGAKTFRGVKEMIEVGIPAEVAQKECELKDLKKAGLSEEEANQVLKETIVTPTVANLVSSGRLDIEKVKENLV